MRHIILLLFSALSLQMCNNKMPVKLISATSQSWAAGTQRGGTGINYAIEVESLTNATLTFTALYTKGKVLEVYGKLKPEGIVNKEAALKGSKYLVIAKEKSINPSPKAELPFASDAEAILELKSDGKSHYLEIEKLEELPHNPMP